MSDMNKKMKQVMALRNGKGIQRLFDEAYKIFKNPLLMHDLDYKVIALTENEVTDDPLWNELVSTGRHGRETIELLKNEDLLDIAANTPSITFLKSEKLKYERLFGKIYNKKNIIVGAADIVACYKPFEDDDAEAFKAFCEILSREVGRIESYQTYGDTYQENLIKRLIDGNIEDKRLYPFHVGIIYDGLEANLRLAVADVSPCDPDPARLPYFRDLFMRMQPAFKYCVYAEYVVILISFDDDAFDVQKSLHKLNRFFGQNNIYAGISARFENLFELKKHYREALDALHDGRKHTDSQRIFLYDAIERNLPE